MKVEQLKPLFEAVLMAADQPLSLEQLEQIFDEFERPARSLIRTVLSELVEDYQGRGIELIELASGWRIQARAQYGHRISRLWQERPQKYSRALLETLALVAYRQPVTRGDIEEIRGVTVSSSIMKTLLEREWVRVIGYRDVPGRPAMYATTRQFLDYFNLKTLDGLPTLSEIRALGESLEAQQQAAIAAEEAKMIAAQEEKRRQMLAQALAEHAEDEANQKQNQNTDSPEDESALTFTALSERLEARLNQVEEPNLDDFKINDEVDAPKQPLIPDTDQ
ncbi:segregation and condensation protein B [Oceanospirillum multiglobuliferum]|uniref:SMC-Scp complex subunit ScpB n=1 Tax=Oceanospirillum multiglobuliferum TaxID=64969 RepID=A0A1T4L7V0_9GAMM|nr:SMC-Scp complex subunit ScpB [Oceanospirillum multiglobuliferum]OPX56761.1 SMC-Scp complex subunit ScpB [Oceanospirillum multiglobuliferum]SJZ50796.1 segregation and condensation protein B [Oceanospirillum multiglobuliferum]